jgi:hypothetical protein
MGFATKLMLSFFFGIIGSGYFVYGRKRNNTVILFSGVLLCIFPYFVSNGWLMLILGLIFLAVPFVIKS